MPERQRPGVTGRISTSHAAARKCDSDPPAAVLSCARFSTRTRIDTRSGALAPVR
jgi:hypothetical protein